MLRGLKTLADAAPGGRNSLSRAAKGSASISWPSWTGAAFPSRSARITVNGLAFTPRLIIVTAGNIYYGTGSQYWTAAEMSATTDSATFPDQQGPGDGSNAGVHAATALTPWNYGFSVDIVLSSGWTGGTATNTTATWYAIE